ncbi:hypothetical protein OHB01_12130 [Microbispora hainanensis]|jgi:hypothetical protein|uniref:Uncharacterized protein n=1 Tax=Microbispora hainanensis TaxID=568844 RepID=A0ABZ1SK89_9ACTN|nr:MULTISPECIES: hypothetical protein [Microbispora]NJP26582.1 hypothetical protein [Microbispora sp. CL1-1]TQS12098.1 hypothetical protein FLW53_20780 [Microbispora sp. SCL1-1]
MTLTRSLAGITLAAGILALAPLATATAAEATAAKSWGPYYATGSKAKVSGSLIAAAKSDRSRPAPYVKVTGKVTSLNHTSSTCGWALFRVSYFDAANKPHLAYRNYRTCSYGAKKTFAFTIKNVGEVELKVCSERKATKPSLTCQYAGSWKTLYAYYQ